MALRPFAHGARGKFEAPKSSQFDQLLLPRLSPLR